MLKLNTDKNFLQKYLLDKGWLNANEGVKAVEKPGEGNMNFTLRIDTGDRTFIIKQSREFVEKYPQVAAPTERVLMEADFYQLISEKPALKAKMPRIMGLDKENSVMALEDLGAGRDYTYLYKEGETIAEDELFQLIDFAVELHQSYSIKSAPKIIHNQKMRALNHQHMYIYPYLEENGMNLDEILPGLQEASVNFKKNDKLKIEAQQLGEIYLAEGNNLLHGDYFPGSWLKTEAGIKVIDPEFCFFGPVEFEMGVTVAHLQLADQPSELVDAALERYSARASMKLSLCKKFAAGEIIRRILGLAQLPLSLNLAKRLELLEKAKVDLLSNN